MRTCSLMEVVDAWSEALQPAQSILFYRIRDELERLYEIEDRATKIAAAWMTPGEVRPVEGHPQYREILELAGMRLPQDPPVDPESDNANAVLRAADRYVRVCETTSDGNEDRIDAGSMLRHAVKRWQKSTDQG